jgi:xylulokinase
VATLSLGLDSSTQSLTAVAVDLEDRSVVWRKSLDYLADPRLAVYGIGRDYLLPPAEPGEANQPAAMYLASLDAVFAALAAEFPDLGLSVGDIAVINTSGQQHGHVLLNRSALGLFCALRGGTPPGADLANLIAPALALPFARIWRTSCTAEEAAFVREKAGGSQAMIELTGSDAPLRFSAFGIRRTGLLYPEAYRETWIVHQISSLIPAVLTGFAGIPLDYGNACGTSLIDYRRKAWSPCLLDAVSEGLPDGAGGLAEKLPGLSSGLSLVGTLAGYFVKRYGFNPSALVGIGSGDNPQTKVLTAGSLLSLGTSFVIMVEADGCTFDRRGYANAMYDALYRPFTFGCRTNGALRWDDVRAAHGFAKEDYGPGERALEETPPGNRGRLFLWQTETESFPVSGRLDPVRQGYESPDFAADYAGIVESTLAPVYVHSQHFMTPGEKLYVSGGPTASAQIMRRAAAIWNRTVVPVDRGGAALGAAVSGACALRFCRGEVFDPAEFSSSFLARHAPVRPRREDVAAYHEPGGFLERFTEAESRLLGL